MKFCFSRVMCLLLALLLLPLGMLEMAIPVSAAYENTYVNTGDQRADILGVARTQVGYRESGGYTKYGEWYGSSYMDWCGAFISWCANQAAVPTSVLKRTGFASPSAFGLSDVFYYSSGRTPQPGDLFFRIDSAGDYAHAGLVYYVEGSYFYTLEGNTWADGDSTHRVMIRQRGLTGSYCFASPKYWNTSGHTHSYEYYNDTTHPHKEYKYCAGCGDKIYTGKTTTLADCITCKQENCKHQYGNYTNQDGTYHKATCPLCEKVESYKHEWVDGEVVKEATCKDTGLKKQSCKQCKASRDVTLPVTEEHKYEDWQYLGGEKHAMVCTVCEQEKEENHKLSSAWSADELSHWYTCEDCGGRLKTSSHTFSGDCESACTTCGYVSPTGHMYGTVLQQDEKAHWYACQRCGKDKDKEDHLFTSDCDDTCDTCGYARETSHSYGEEWESHAGGHWQVCQVCHQSSEIQSHSGSKTLEEGQALLCAQCGYEMAPAAEHSHVYTVTSHNQGGHYGACTCGAQMTQTNHSWSPQTGKCEICQEPAPAVGTQASILRFVVSKVGNTPYLWLIFVLPIVAVLAILLLIVLVIVVIRKRSRNIDDDDDEDGFDDGGDSEEKTFAEQEMQKEREESGMEPLPV